MDFALNADDMATLTTDQKEAIMESLFLAIAVDRSIDPEELATFRGEAEKIPWGLEADAMQQTFQKAHARVNETTDRETWLAWVQEIAERLPTLDIREKVVGTMAKLAFVGGLEKREKGLLNAFIMAFELSEERVAKMREAFGR